MTELRGVCGMAGTGCGKSSFHIPPSPAAAEARLKQDVYRSGEPLRHPKSSPELILPEIGWDARLFYMG